MGKKHRYGVWYAIKNTLFYLEWVEKSADCYCFFFVGCGFWNNQNSNNRSSRSRIDRYRNLDLWIHFFSINSIIFYEESEIWRQFDLSSITTSIGALLKKNKTKKNTNQMFKTKIKFNFSVLVSNIGHIDITAGNKTDLRTARSWNKHTTRRRCIPIWFVIVNWILIGYIQWWKQPGARSFLLFSLSLSLARRGFFECNKTYSRPALRYKIL